VGHGIVRDRGDGRRAGCSRLPAAVETASRDASLTGCCSAGATAAPRRKTARPAEFRDALQHIVAAGKSDGVVRTGPAELWTDVWLALVAFVAERVGAKEWAPDAAPVGMALDAAWDAIAARATESP
jgi:hypothetical protein